MPDPVNFQKSITKELEVIKDRVTQLIDHAHHGETGRYREAILKTVLRKHLPRNISVGTGFIIEGDGDQRSRQLDIIVFDNTKPVLFSDGDFVITTMTNVLGIIEVKSSIPNLNDVIEQFEESTFNFHARLLDQEQPKIFTGIFSYEFTGNINAPGIDAHLRNSNTVVNHISFGTRYFIRKWRQQDAPNLGPPAIECLTDFYNVYDIPDLSYSYFISNLIHIVTGGINDRYWFSFPIPGTKEMNRMRTVCLDENV